MSGNGVLFGIGQEKTLVFRISHVTEFKSNRFDRPPKVGGFRIKSPKRQHIPDAGNVRSIQAHSNWNSS